MCWRGVAGPEDSRRIASLALRERVIAWPRHEDYVGVGCRRSAQLLPMQSEPKLRRRRFQPEGLPPLPYRCGRVSPARGAGAHAVGSL
jgi:hypothetical protein